MNDISSTQETPLVTLPGDQNIIPVIKPPSKSVKAAQHFKRAFADEFEAMKLSVTSHEFTVSREDFYYKVLLGIENATLLSVFPLEKTPEWTQLISEVNGMRKTINTASIVGEVLPPFELSAKNGEIIVRDSIAFMTDKAARTFNKIKTQIDTSKSNMERAMRHVVSNLDTLPPESRAVVLANMVIVDNTSETIEAVTKQQLAQQARSVSNLMVIFDKEMASQRRLGVQE